MGDKEVEGVVLSRSQVELVLRVLNDFYLVLQYGAGGVYRKQIQDRIEKVEKMLEVSDGKKEEG